MSRLLFAPRTVGGPHLFAWLRDGEPEQRSAVVSQLTAAGRPAVASIVTDAGTAERVQGTAVALGDALSILAALPADDLEIAPPTVAVWSLASKLALDLVARERIVPVIDATNAGAEARWGVSLLLPEDADRFRRLARAFPPAAHAIPIDDAPTIWAAEDLLLSYLDEVANELALGTIDPAEARAGRWEGKLAHALTAPDAERLFLPAGVLERGLIDELTAWAAPARGSLATRAPRLCLKLDPPVAATPWWRINYLLQAADDPSLLLPARDVWATNRPEGETIARAFGDAQDVLLRELSRAARILPPIQTSLDAQKPEGLRLDTAGAWSFLSEAAGALGEAGFGVMLPSEIASAGSGRLRLKMHLGDTKVSAKSAAAAALSLDTVVKYKWEATLGGEPITAEEFERLVKMKRQLVRWRGQWVALDPDEISEVRKALGEKGGQITMREALSATLSETAPVTLNHAAVDVVAEGPLATLIAKLREGAPALPLPTDLNGQLRPYQERGFGWLGTMAALGLGGILADDMGLGKTIQTIAYLLARRTAQPKDARPTLVVCPTSVVGNWERELARFAPTLPVVRHHGPERAKDAAALKKAKHAVVITTYGMLRRDRALLGEVDWSVAVLDEAQNVKNPAAQQAAAARALRGSHRFALTGTPVENRLAELWSILEFCVPGYLGPLEKFRREYALPIERYHDGEAAERLRSLVRPFVLRRLKSDPNVAGDLPPKEEMPVVCTLTREQATLYQAAVDEAMRKIEGSDGIARRGNVLALLTALKQICNHPAHYLKERGPLPGRSGKLARITEMLEETVAAGDHALVFTQFREMGDRLVAHLESALDLETLYLHGGVPREKRDEMVQRFQEDPRAPHVFVLSLRAGGTGLNLTRATRVFHFDRWWNPAVEDQATDRAHRIGQTQVVQVYTLLAAGTIEEKIDTMLRDKRALAEQIVGEGETWITEMTDADLRKLVTLSDAAIADEVEA